MGFVGLFLAVNSIVSFEEEATIKIGEFWAREDGIFYFSFLCLSGWFLFGERKQGFTLQSEGKHCNKRCEVEKKQHGEEN